MNEKKEQWTVGSILKWTRQYFCEKGVASPRLDAEVLLSHILGKDRLYLYVHFDRPLDEQELTEYRRLVKQRALRTPVAYLVGYKEFMGLPFAVTPDVLIPRPDTEVLVEAVLERVTEKDQTSILDIGTGSGAIIISLLTKLPQARGLAVDLSAAALAVAGQNAVNQQVGDRLQLVAGDIFEPVLNQRFDVIVSNPPYIPDKDIAGLEPEVRQEPHGALAGGQDGLDFYRRIISQAPGYVNPGGFLALEVGIHQAEAVAALAEAGGILTVEAICQDYGGVERVLILRAP
ncbi:release factor glutamine methyltransferase [Anaerospora hongkongensis]|uniref:Release factor glutamine methyltransferase n=1 Tax=Anaerospora hongkongensis TaxID=244830 RepID=A0A4R1PZ64_9FIRM|nr:peptide chain release factor N(5)-glutamine methyltransferase [Anaerospora hongkongensis]TCL33291.1 release factor glutamine methyltransferase [Anaerospora hongkongensis]